MGRAFGKYQLSRRIGVGATAEVFDATRDDGEEIVVKRILPQRASDPQFQELFEREAKIVRELSHPNVVALLDFGPRSASVRALVPCSGLEISARALRQLSEAHLKDFALVYMNLGREVSRRLRKADDRLFQALLEKAPAAEGWQEETS